MNRARLCPISHNARGICKVSRAQRSEAELWARGILHIPEFCDVAPRAAGERATSRTEGLPARIMQKERALSVSEGGAILQNVRVYQKFFRNEMKKNLGEENLQTPEIIITQIF